MSNYDQSNRAPGVVYYPTVAQYKRNGRVADIYSLMGEHRPSYTHGVNIFDAGTGANDSSLGYFPNIQAAIKAARTAIGEQP